MLLFTHATVPRFFCRVPYHLCNKGERKKREGEREKGEVEVDGVEREKVENQKKIE